MVLNVEREPADQFITGMHAQRRASGINHTRSPRLDVVAVRNPIYSNYPKVKIETKEGTNTYLTY